MIITLYHFTSLWHYKTIRKEGLFRGDVPTSPYTGKNAVWFTKNPDPTFQNWKQGSVVDKTMVRITVQFNTLTQPTLHKWTKWAKRERINKLWLDSLNNVGGGDHENWYIYFGVIPVQAFTKVEVWNDGRYVSME